MLIEKIKEEWRALRRSPLLFVVILAIFGIILLLHPHSSIGFVVRLAGFVLLADAGIRLYQGYANPSRGGFSVFRSLDVILGVAGLFLLVRPTFLIRLFPTILGIVLIGWGLFQLWMQHMMGEGIAFDRQHLPVLLYRGLPVLIGCFLFLFPGSAVNIAVRLVGAYLVLWAVVDFELPRRIMALFNPSLSGEDDDEIRFRDPLNWDSFQSFFSQFSQFKSFTSAFKKNGADAGADPFVDVVDSDYGSPDDIMADYRVVDEDEE